MNSPFNKPMVIFFTVLASTLIPILILVLFFLIFSDFYSEGFLTGLGHILVCGFMMILNSTLGTILVLKTFEKGTENEDGYVPIRILLMVLGSFALQVVLSILVENPFKDPPPFSFM